MVPIAGIALLAFVAAHDVGLTAQELAPGVFVLGSSQRFGAANLGAVVFEDHVVLIGAPHAERLAACLDEIKRVTEKPVRAAILTHVRDGTAEAAQALARAGITLVAQREAAESLRNAFQQMRRAPGADASVPVREFVDQLVMKDERQEVEIRAQGRIGGAGDAVVYLPRPKVLFAGPLCIHGPRAVLAGTDTLRWLTALRSLRELPCRTVVPGAGSVGDAWLLERQECFLRELRRQVGHLVAQGRPLDAICAEVRITPGYLVWMPYDNPTREDVEHVYRGLTVPLAPFGGRDDPAVVRPPKALAVIADSPHDPEPIETGLGRALERAGVYAYFTVDPRALTAENLKQVQLLVMLRDGAIWPAGRTQPAVTWMTPAQERAVVDFVEGGGGLLALHNATALYPEGGPYLELLGGTYRGHGPLERFRVAVVDRAHPITRSVVDFEVADEQHTPSPDRGRVAVFLESRSAEGTIGEAGWTRKTGRGRVCYLANGHTREALEHPEYQKLLRNAALWCVSQNDDDTAERPSSGTAPARDRRR